MYKVFKGLIFAVFKGLKFAVSGSIDSAKKFVEARGQEKKCRDMLIRFVEDYFAEKKRKKGEEEGEKRRKAQ